MEYKVGALSQFKIIDKENRIIGGFLGDDNVDTDGHIIPVEMFMKAIEEYLPWGNIRDAHKNAAGIVTAHGTKGWNYIEVKVVDDNAWKMVESGVYKGFSIGARVYEKTTIPFSSIPLAKLKNLPAMTLKALQKIGKVIRIDSMLLAEISLTDRPINQAALFAKSTTIDDMPVLQSIIEKDLVTVSNSGNLAPTTGATMRYKKRKMKKTKEKMMEDTTNKEVVADVTEPIAETVQKSDAIEAIPDIQVIADEVALKELAQEPVASQDEVPVAEDVNKELGSDVVKDVQSSPTSGAVPPKKGDMTDPNIESPAVDPMDAVKAYIDASNMNLYTAMTEQFNIGLNMASEKITAVVTAFMNQMMQCMADDAEEDATDPADATENKSVEADVVVAESLPVLTADIVKAMVKEAMSEVMPANVTLRKGMINKGDDATIVAETPKPVTKTDKYREVATLMAQASIKK